MQNQFTKEMLELTPLEPKEIIELLRGASTALSNQWSENHTKKLWNYADQLEKQLERLCAEIEREWKDNRNPDKVDELAEAHPYFAMDLYEFFAELVEVEILGKAGKSKL